MMSGDTATILQLEYKNHSLKNGGAEKKKKRMVERERKRN